MEEKKIIIDIGDDGSIFAETFGMVGTECIDELDKLMKDIAREGTGKKKPEYFQTRTQTSNIVKNKRQ